MPKPLYAVCSPQTADDPRTWRYVATYARAHGVDPATVGLVTSPWAPRDVVYLTADSDAVGRMVAGLEPQEG